MCCCSTLALRLDVSGDPTFSNALRRAQKAATAAFAHGAAPFSKVVEALKTVRSAAFTPVYQVMLVVEDDTAAVSAPSASGELRLDEPVIYSSASVLTDLVVTLQLRCALLLTYLPDWEPFYKCRCPLPCLQMCQLRMLQILSDSIIPLQGWCH